MSSPSQPDTPADGDDRESTRDDAPREIDFKAVARISTQAQLRSVRLKTLHADMVENDGPIPPDWTTEVLTGLAAEVRLNREAKQLTAVFGFLAVYAPGVDPAVVDALPDPKDAPVELHARFQLVYDLEDVSVVEEADPVHFAMSNGVLHAWPYWRELAQSTTTRMGLTPLMVGMVKIPWTGDPAGKAATAE